MIALQQSVEAPEDVELQPPECGLDPRRGRRALVHAVRSPGSVSAPGVPVSPAGRDRKSTRLNSSHRTISYAVFCLKKKKVMRQAHDYDWFIAFDTLTMADYRLEAFYNTPNSLRYYYFVIDRIGLAGYDISENGSHA